MSVPEWFIVQTSDLQVRQLSRALAANAGWWRAQFGADARLPPKAIREHLGLPVYCVNLPAAVVDAMLDLLHFPTNASDAYHHLPLVLKKIATLASWRGYMVEYGFIVPEEEDDEDEPASKKARILNPYEEGLVRFATTLHEYIFREHPDATALLNGDIDILRCEFAYSVPPSPREYRVPDPAGAGAERGVTVGRWLADLGPKTNLVIETLKRLCNANAVSIETIARMDPKSRAATGHVARDWPSNGAHFARQTWTVVELQYQY